MATAVFGRLKRVAWNALIAALAVGVAAFSRALALRPDPAVEQLLNSPYPVALAIDSLRRRPEETAASKSPLVVQAEAFALFYLEVSGACLRLCEVSGQNRYLRIAGSAIGPSVAVGCALHASNVP